MAAIDTAPPLLAAVAEEVVRQLFAWSGRKAGVGALIPRKREVLGPGGARSVHSAICAALVLAPVSVEIPTIFAKLDLAPDDDARRRVRAVLAYLNQ